MVRARLRPLGGADTQGESPVQHLAFPRRLRSARLHRWKNKVLEYYAGRACSWMNRGQAGLLPSEAPVLSLAPGR
jgi:hypothetical protein